MFSYIAKLQQKSREEKRRVAMIVAAFFTGGLFFVWLLTFLSTTPNGQEESVAEETGPFLVLKEKMREGIQLLKEIF